MSKRRSEAASQELAFLAALDSVHADVDISEIAEIQDWSRAVRGKFYGATVKDASKPSKLKPGLPSALGHPNAANTPVSSSEGVTGVIRGTSGNVASYGNVQYSKMAIPHLISVCTSEQSEGAWSEFVRRSRPVITAAIFKTVRRFGNVSHTLVEDLTQDVFLKLCADNFRALRNVEIPQENAFWSFLKVMATHTVQDYRRIAATFRTGAAREPEWLETDRVLPEHAPSSVASSELERKILLAEIDTILKTLSHEPNFARDRAIFWLYYRKGLTAKAIAELPGVQLSVKGVESVLLRLTQWMKVALEPRRTSQPGRKTSAE